MIKEGSKVKFDYTLTVEGEVVDTSVGKQPLEYTQGEGHIIPGLESQLAGMKIGDEKKVEVKAAEGYGERDPQAIQEVGKGIFPDDFELKTGMMIPLQDNQGRQFSAMIHEIKDEAVVLDLKHPLAGKNLTFEVKIVSID
ncbi:MAG: peptidylprolyl isomerase [Spirochaetes bacterium]|nr:peptidylprolyl isomerase [Spirochaetota bacterium]